MVVESAALATLAAKLITTGLDAWAAGKVEGWGTEEAKAFGSALNSIESFKKLLGAKPDASSQVEKYCTLITVAFGEAWRRHWAYDERLAPPSRSRIRDWFGGDKAKRREQVEAALQDGRFAAVLGDGRVDSEVEFETRGRG